VNKQVAGVPASTALATVFFINGKFYKNRKNYVNLKGPFC
jgi:hypothetical protein